MAIFYKGAGVGSHWHIHDSRKIGFTARSSESNPSTEVLIEHIATSTLNSPYISVTRSYAVAWNYAMIGETDRPTPDNPAYIYEIEINNSSPSDIKLIDPIKEVALSFLEPLEVNTPEEYSYYQHNGLQSYLLGVVNPQEMERYLLGRSPAPPGPGTEYPTQPKTPLKTLINTLRDAEILILGDIPKSCVKNRFDVTFSGID
ncbi:hypothetical protein C6497_05275 [Candidatus Poribacteria bacterium]|nr:MAG: hypothetical protein C6497_05275 [Candidatus Poribacteria bacterium]